MQRLVDELRVLPPVRVAFPKGIPLALFENMMIPFLLRVIPTSFEECDQELEEALASRVHDPSGVCAFRIFCTIIKLQMKPLKRCDLKSADPASNLSTPYVAVD